MNSKKISLLINFLTLLFCFLNGPIFAKSASQVIVGIDQLFEPEYVSLLKDKRIGLITNHTAINRKYQSTIAALKAQQKSGNFKLVALFAPEHGITGAAYASQTIEELIDSDGMPIFSLYGTTERPTEEMLKNISLLLFDIQDIGSRSYTYVSTLFYVMEEAAKHDIPLIVLDRPNPINGVVVDGPLLEEKWRSSVGYINVPYCHGMTIGELAHFFNGEYKIGCKLKVVPMKNWHRKMCFQDTGLPWIPTSPYIPEATTSFFYPITGILGELKLVNIGIGYTLPFKLVGAPWIDAEKFAKKLNGQKFPGVHFEPFHYRPMFGRCARQQCQGVLILVTDPLHFKPMATQYLIIGMLKSLYPEKFKEAVALVKKNKNLICKLNGTEEIYRIITEEKNIVWKLVAIHAKEKEEFLKLRKKYLLDEYKP